MFRNAARLGSGLARNGRMARTAPIAFWTASRFASSNVRAATANPARRWMTVGAGVTAAVMWGAYNVVEAQETKVDFEAVRKAIAKLLEDDPDLGPTLVRLAWHSSGTWDKTTKTGGSNGATMRFKPESEHGANAGLHIARNALEPIKRAFPEASYADIYTLSGVVAIEEMGGPKITWRSGRSDAASGDACPPDGRLPNADMGAPKKTIQHVRDIFYRMGFTDREIVALIGAHSLGRTHREASGYTGPWTRAPTSFSNEFFRELIENKWTLKTWEGPDQFEDPTGELMMLPADMAFLWDKQFRQYVEMYAKDEQLFFADFAKAFQKLEEFGVNFDGKKGWWPF